VRSYRAGEIHLDNGHMWIDGHVYPHAFFSTAEVRAIEAFGKMRHRVIHEIKETRYHPTWAEGMQQPEFDDSTWELAPVGRGTGRQFSEDVYRFKLPPLPAPAPGRELFFALRPLHPSKEAWPETTIYINGKAEGALVRWHDFWEISSLLDRTRENQITLKAFGIYNEPPRGFRQIAIVERDPVFERLYWNMRVLCEAASIIPETEAVHAEIKSLIREVLTSVDLVQLETPTGRERAAKADEKLEQGRLALRGKIESTPSPARDFTVDLVYHAHHDSAWQWTVAHSRGKTERAILNNLYLMDRYPDYRYLYTAPFHYETLREDRPDLFARVQEKVRKGQWEANGAMWNEADVRLPSGESLIRQMLYGIQYFEQHFGLKPDEHVLFLPDTFGHSPVMPQIMRGFGVDTLFAMRIRDQQNPHDVFRWQGIDGTQVLVNAITTPAWEYPYLPELHGRAGGGIGGGDIADRVSYSAPDPGPRRTFGVWETFRQKAATPRQIMTIGWGDGGGGGTEDHIEVARRVAELPWLPRLAVTPLVELTRAQHKNWDKYPVYADDIYVGFQRTFTRANRLKQEDRAANRLLHNTEFFGAWAQRLGTAYDGEKVKQGWRKMLLNHMHDIITGQSVPEANDEAIALYEPFRAAVQPVFAASLAAVLREIQTSGDSVVFFNTLGFERGGVREVALPAGKTLTDSAGRALPTQRLDEQSALVQLAAAIPAYGYEALALCDAPPPPPPARGLNISDRVLENEFLRITLNEQAEIGSFFDKRRQRELVPAGRAHNQLLAVRGAAGGGPTAAVTAPGTPITQLESVRVVERGPLRAAWEIVRRQGDSTIRQRLVLAVDATQLEIHNDIDWREATELHVDFPLDLKTTTALQGIQFGHQRQSTTRNNPADASRSLLAVHDWLAVAEDDYGFAALNDGRMGHDVKSGGIRIVLFTNQQVANANGDRGANRFAYALKPYVGSLTDAGVVHAAHNFNHPLLAERLPAQSGRLPTRFGVAEVRGAPSVLLSEIKPAEDGDGWILRLYESGGRRTKAEVALNVPVTSATAVNLREDGNESLPVQAGRVTLDFSPFQIRTVRIR
jgi:alpha-mannosidase